MTRKLAHILVVRFLVLWLCARGLLILAGALAGVPLWPSVGLSVRLAAVLSAIAFVDMRRRGERILFANLGVGSSTVLAGAFAVALAAEGALGLAMHTFSR